jgi:uncharacterized protein YggE
MQRWYSGLARDPALFQQPPSAVRVADGGARGHTGPMSEPDEQPTGITVIGSGSAPAAVDRVTISLAVEVVRAQPGDAFGIASVTATRLLAVLADGGVDSRSVRTSDLTLGPRTEYANGHQQVLGYQAGQRLTVVLEGLNGIERLLTDVASLGGDGVRIDGVSLSPGHPEEALIRAREAAFADAAAKAQQLAGLAGRTLGRVQWVDERPAGGGGPRPMMAMRAADSMAMPVATGDAEVGVSITVSWAFQA